MWFIADFFERYTNRVAKTFIRLAALEADADRKAQEAAREARRLKYRAGEAVKATRDPLPVIANARHEHANPTRAEASAPQGIPALTDVPMGVRGDVVAHYLAAFKSANGSATGLVEKLRKDKKVRVAELQLIASKVLDEDPTTRKKGEHLDALRAHFSAPAPAAAVREVEPA
ncbi:MAG: hypothetical protein AAGD34_22055 [Pseudomonadota bacterium]